MVSRLGHDFGRALNRHPESLLGRGPVVFRLTPPFSTRMAYPPLAVKGSWRENISADPGDGLIQVLKGDI